MSYQEVFLTPEPLITNLKDRKLIAKIFGVPFDATSTFRPGSRFGPNAIRQAFMNIEVYSTVFNVDAELLGIKDLGNMNSLGSLDSMINFVSKVAKEIMSERLVCVALGGEHTITFGTNQSLSDDIALIIFDAHLDLRDEFAGLKLSHATFLRRLLEKRKTESIFHIGSRAASLDEWEFAKKNGLAIISTQSVNTIKNSEKLFLDFLKDYNQIYLSLDLDVLDPCYAPAVGNPEPAGLTIQQLLDFIYSLKGKRIAGFDIVELTPIYDNGITAITAAKLLAELLCLSTKNIKNA